MGETYAQRLWCAWELFTLFSFQSYEDALALVHIVGISDKAAVEFSMIGDYHTPLHTLKRFDVNDAHAYGEL